MSQIWGESMRPMFCDVCHVALGTGLYADNTMPMLSSRVFLSLTRINGDDKMVQ